MTQLPSSSPRSSIVFVLVLAGAAAAGGACGSSQPASSGGGGHASQGTGGHGAGSGSSLAGFGGFGGAGPGSLLSLTFEPPSTTLTLDGVTPQMTSFTLKAHFQDGSSAAVIPEAVQFDRPDLSSVQVGSPIVLTAPGQYAGVGTLHGIYLGVEATATLTVDVHVKDADPGVDPGVITKLDQPNLPQDPAVASLLYPYDATVFPQALASPLIQWSAPAAANLYRVHYEETHYSFDGYYPIKLPASARVPQKFWDKIVASNPGGPLDVELSRYDAASMTAYSSAKQEWTIAPASLRGAIYYWTTSGTGQMARIQPGGLWQSLYGGQCMGCHAVSSDGSTLVAAVEGVVTNDGSNDNRAWVSFDLPAATVRKSSTFFAANVAVNHDGKYTVFGTQKLRLADTATGLEIPNTGLEALPLLPTSVGLMTPAFSPDGKHLAAVEGAGSWYHNLTGGRLATMDFDEVKQAFSGYKGLALASDFPAGQQAIAYPTYSPDSQWIAFHVGDYATGCDVQGCTDTATQIGTIAIQSTSGAPAVVMHTLADPVTPNPADKNHTFEPTFNPIERGGYFWVVVTSMRDYGNRITGTANNGKKRLWVAAIDKNPAPGKDPSHPPFFLEGQDETTTNMRGFWALSACIPTQGGGACSNGFECCSGFCDMGQCVDPQTYACTGVGGPCTATSDCCNNTLVQCLNGVCTPKPPK